jgi:small basic protein
MSLRTSGSGDALFINNPKFCQLITTLDPLFTKDGIRLELKHKFDKVLSISFIYFNALICDLIY